MQTQQYPRLSRNPQDEHTFYELGSKRFEHFARALHETQPNVFGTQLYGPDGQQQYGADHIALCKDSSDSYIEIGQSKAERRFGPREIRAAADKFLNHWESHWREKDVRCFILFVGCSIKSRLAGDEIIAQTKRFAGLGVQFSVWDSTVIYDHLHGANVVVRNYLGQDWYEHIFGRPVGLLSGLQQDLDRGWDLSALRLQSFVTRLNQAEAGEIAELKRRVRRGETKRVVAELESAVRSEAFAAIANDIKADKLRLLAGLLMASGDFPRINQLLSQADVLNGESTRLRAVLMLEAIGPQAVLDGIQQDGKAEIAEVRAVSWLRQGQAHEAYRELEAHLDAHDVRAETLRLAALSKLLASERAEAVAMAARAVVVDPDTRACKHMLAICHFHRALAPIAEVATGEWPSPVDQPLVNLSESARADLERAESLFLDLCKDNALEGHTSMVMWHFAVLACMPWRHAEAAQRLTDLQASGEMPIPLIAWALSRALPFDHAAAVDQCNQALAADPNDVETLVIRLALANADGDYSGARRLLSDHSSAFAASGNAHLHDYWQAIVDIETRRTPQAAALRTHASLRLRLAMDARPKKRRRAAIASVLDEQLRSEGDPRVILAASQMLLELGWNKSALEAASYLVEKIGTAEALATAAHIYHRNGKPSQVIATLKHLDAFPAAKLPVELERLRANSLAAVGELVGARNASILIAQATKNPADIWRSIQFQLAIGATPEALSLYEQNAMTLAKPSPGHIALARAVLHSHPDSAVRITQHIASDAPDEFVTAALDLAHKLRLAAEQRVLTGRLQQLGAQGKGGVTLVSMDEIIELMRERREKAERAFELYATGHAPVYLMASFGHAALARAYLEPLLDPPHHDERRTLLSTRYGRRTDGDHWPTNLTDVRLLADVTALLTAHGLGILEVVERSFGPVWIAPGTIQAVLAMRSDSEVVQPNRIQAMKTVLARLDAGRIGDQSHISNVDAFAVLWDCTEGDACSTLSFSRLYEIVASALDEKAQADTRGILGNTLDGPPEGPRPQAGAVLILQHEMAVTLEEAGLLAALASQFKIGLHSDEIIEMRLTVRDAASRNEIVKSLSELINKLRDGLEDGTYKPLPDTETQQSDHAARGFMQILASAQKEGGVAWVDDRFTSGISGVSLHTATTVEIIDALSRYGRITGRQASRLRQQLRAARWLFMPLHGDEIARFVRDAVSEGSLRETNDLAVIRRSTGEAIINRRRLQWPEPSALEQGVRGEVPFLLDIGHAVSQALASIWNDDSWSVSDAEVASAWIIDTLELSLFPLQVLGAGDPRSDHLLGIHLGSLVLVAIQIFSGKRAGDRQRAYLDWLWGYLLAHTLRVRPEVRAGLEEMIESHLTRTEDGAREDRVWLALAGRALNAMPLPLRVSFFERPSIREAFDMPEHGQVTVDGHDFDELVFWDALLKVNCDTPTKLESVSGEAGVLSWLESNGDQAVTLEISGRKMRLDPWPRFIASSDRAARRQALLERNDIMDMSAEQLDDFNSRLELIYPEPGRIRAALAQSHSTMQHWYADLRSGLSQRQAFSLPDLAPGSIRKLLLHLRLEGDLEHAAQALLADRGLMTAVERIGGMPIAPPLAIVEAVAALDDCELQAFLSEVEQASLPPWTQLFIADCIGGRALGREPAQRVKIWVERSLADDSVSLWALYIAFAQFSATEFYADRDWMQLSAQQQLAISWSHASSLVQVMVAGKVIIDKVVQLLGANRLASPRVLVERVNNFGQDSSDPNQMSVDRLRAHVAAPVLERFLGEALYSEWAEAELRNLIIDASGEASRPRMNIIRNVLASHDALPGRCSASLGELFNDIHSNSGDLFRDKVEELLRSLLSENIEVEAELAVWLLLRQASGDSPLPVEMAELAYQRGKAWDLTLETPDLGSARHQLLNFTALAAAHGWQDQIERIDAAALALGPREGDDGDEAILLFEIAIWRARMIQDIPGRLKHLSQELLRLGRHPSLREQATVAALHFGRSLSGQQAEPFVDAFGELIATC